MKTMIKTLVTAALFSTFAIAEDVVPTDVPMDKEAKVSEAKSKQQEKLAEALGRMPEEVKEKVLAAKVKAKKAKEKLDKMEKDGATPEELQKEVNNRRAEARLNLQKAIDALDGVGEKAQARVEKAKDKIQQRLDDRKAEATEIVE